MAVDAHANFAYSTVATAPSPASSGTSLVVASGEGALFPAVPFNATVWPAGANPLSSTAEIVRVTNVSTDTLTITRAQESTSARSILVGDQLAATITKKLLTDIENTYLPLVAGGASVENIGAVESNVNTVATTGATETLDTSVYAVHDCTMDQSCTFTFSNPAPSGKNTTFVLILRGAFTPTFPAAVKWGDGAAPTYSTPTIYTFTTVDAGTTWYGQSVGKAFA